MPPSPNNVYTIELGREVNLACRVRRSSGSTLNVYKIGDEVPEPRQTSFQPILSDDSPVTSDDEGVYRCVSTSADGNSTTVNITINVQGKI